MKYRIDVGSRIVSRGRGLSVVLGLCAVVWSVAGCGGDDDGGGPPPTVHTVAPLCSTVAGGNPKELFTAPVVPTANVQESLIFGGMDPGTLEPINFELGFHLNDIDVPVTAPADLYVGAIETTEYLTGWRAGNTDYAISFHVCSDDSSGELLPAVEGHFAHMTALSPALQAVLDGLALDCALDENNPEETMEKCHHFFPISVEDGFVIEAGTVIGSGGGTGLNAYTPGFDFNLLDTRYPNPYVNPDRIGSEEGPGRWFRYGACLYEYFVEPHRTEYLALVGQNAQLRVSATEPCGTLAVDEAGTAGGIWIHEDAAGLDIETDWVGVLENLLVLAPHPVLPEDYEVISSEMIELTDWMGSPVLTEFMPVTTGDVNVTFYDMVPGPIYCVFSDGYGIGVPYYFYLQLGAGGDTLTIEPLDANCNSTPLAMRAFTPAALGFVR